MCVEECVCADGTPVKGCLRLLNFVPSSLPAAPHQSARAKEWEDSF